MREFVTRYNSATNVLPKRFEPVASEIFTVDVLPGREFITIVQGKQHGETNCFAVIVFYITLKRITKDFVKSGNLFADRMNVKTDDKLSYAKESHSNGASKRLQANTSTTHVKKIDKG